jgi:hypothetical protein
MLADVAHLDRHPDHSRPRRAAAPGLALAAGALFLLAAGCRRDEITHFKVPKEAGALAMATAAPAGGPSMAGDVPPPPTPSGAAALRWKLPKGWKSAQGGGQMRYATLTPAVKGKVDVSVVVLPGPAGGELANVNRWRNQIGLAPLTEGALTSSRKSQRTKAGEVSLYDFVSEGTAKTRTMAGFTVVQGNTWFLKMTGDAAAVETARPAFLELIGSLDLDDPR